MAKVTLDDIARELNISKASVGCALSDRAGNTRISEETRQRVVEVARRMNYHSHAGARALRTSRFDNIGYFVAVKARGDYAFVDIILDGLSEGATRHKQNIVMVQIPGEAAMQEIPKALRERCLDALIIQESSSFLPGFQAAVEASGIPVVYMNEKQPSDSVYVDDVESGRLATTHLVERGFRKIAILAPQTLRDHYSTADRIEGYLEVMEEAGLKPLVKRVISRDFDQATQAWLASGDLPEAIFCTGDLWAVRLLQVFYRLRLRVPDDIAICGCDGWHHASWSAVPLTTVVIPFPLMALAALEMAMQRVASPGHKPSVVLRPTLRVLDSSLRPPPTPCMESAGRYNPPSL
jgi:LacI family transcriptional regulator